MLQSSYLYSEYDLINVNFLQEKRKWKDHKVRELGEIEEVRGVVRESPSGGHDEIVPSNGASSSGPVCT